MDGDDIELAIHRFLFRTNLRIAEFESLGCFFPDASLHYIYCSFDSLAKAKVCPCGEHNTGNPPCKTCPYTSDYDENEKQQLLRSSFSAICAAELLTCKFLVVEYRRTLEKEMELFKLSQKDTDKYLKTDGTEEEETAIASYRNAVKEYSSAKDRVKELLDKNECGEEAEDIYDFLEDGTMEEAETTVELFRDYVAKARRVYMLSFDVIPICQKVFSQKQRKHVVLNNIYQSISCAAFLILVYNVVSRMLV